jgi:hypothetical protein
MRRSDPKVPQAQVTLRAYRPAPARIELSYRPLPGRLARTLLSLVVFWGAIPFVLWVPPHYPWVVGCFVAGLYLAHRAWTGRYRVYAFAGICPRCGHPISLGLDHAISLPHTLTCFHCHFEPCLEVRFEPGREAAPLPQHRTPDCAGIWELRWLADDPFVICDRCLAAAPATPAARVVAEAENDRAALLARLAREGKRMM